MLSQDDRLWLRMRAEKMIKKSRYIENDTLFFFSKLSSVILLTSVVLLLLGIWIGHTF